VHYQSTAYEDAAHGMAMFEPSRDPNPMQIIVTFLNQLGLCEACN
jgi:antitoxin component HigA of HigAB toxin-antitoxin module